MIMLNRIAYPAAKWTNRIHPMMYCREEMACMNGCPI
jgi:hypothetical protein